MIVKIQAYWRYTLQKRIYKKFMEGIVCIYTVRHLKYRVRITVLKVQLKQTKIEKHTKTEHKRSHKGGDEKVEDEIITKTNNIAEVNFIVGYEFIAQNLDDDTNTIRKITKGKLPRFPVDYLRKALQIEWLEDKVVKLVYQDLSSSQMDEIKKVYISYAQNARSLQSTTWKIVKQSVNEYGHAVSLAYNDVDDMKRAYIQLEFTKSPFR